MSTAKEYLENLQGLLLFMHVKRKTIISLNDLSKLDKGVRKDLEIEFKKAEQELVDWHNAKMDEIFKDLLEYQMEEIKENAKHLSFEDIQKELKEIVEYLEQRKNAPIPSKFQDKITYSIIEPKLKEIAHAATSLGVKNTPDIILGTLYTERVNAAAIRIRKTGEYIIAFESQLFSFLNRFTKIIVQALPEKTSNDPDKFEFSFLKTDVEKHIKEHPIIKTLFADLILSYVLRGNVNQAQNFKLDYGRYINGTYILRATELFVMGHEYGHIVKGHLQPKLNSEIEIANISADEIERKWEQEYEADSLGLFFMIKILHEIVDKARSIKRFGNENRSNGSESHPPAKLRRENLRKAFRMSFSQEQLQRAEVLPNALEEILYYLWDETKPLLYKHYEIHKGK